MDIHIDAAKGLVDGSCLNFCHSIELHISGDGFYDIVMDQSLICEIFEVGDRAGLLRLLLSLGGGSGNLSPCCALVEGGSRDGGNSGRSYPD